MQCVILAAGEGRRMRPLTETTPKPLVPLLKRPLIDHIAAALPRTIHEIVLVVRYRKEDIQAYVGTSFHGRPVIYREQAASARGTGAALHAARDVMRGTFLVLVADDVHGSRALMNALTHPPALLGARAAHPQQYGVIETNRDGTLHTILEKPANPPSNFVNTGALVLDERIFKYVRPPRLSSGEQYLTDGVTQLARETSIAVFEQSQWLPLTTPIDLMRAQTHPPAWLLHRDM